MTHLEAPTSAPQFKGLLVRFVVVTVLTVVGIVVVTVLLDVFASYDTSSSFGIVTAIIPALDAGQAFARRSKRAPTSGESWRLSFIFVVLNLLIGLILLLVVGYFGGTEFSEIAQALGIPALLAITLGVMVFYLLIIRFFLGWGAKNELKRLKKVDAKDQ